MAAQDDEMETEEFGTPTASVISGSKIAKKHCYKCHRTIFKSMEAYDCGICHRSAHAACLGGVLETHVGKLKVEKSITHICNECKPKLSKKLAKDKVNDALEASREANSKLAADVLRLKQEKTKLLQEVSAKEAILADLNRENIVLKNAQAGPSNGGTSLNANKRSRTDGGDFSANNFADYIDKLTENQSNTLAKAFENALKKQTERFEAFEKRIDGKYIEVVDAINEIEKAVAQVQLTLCSEIK